MKQKTITGESAEYSIDELSEEVKQKVIERNREINLMDDFWFEGLLENFREKASNLGFDIERKSITFDLFSKGAYFGIERDGIKINENLVKGYSVFIDTPKKVGIWHSDFPVMRWNKTGEEDIEIEEISKGGEILTKDDESLEGMVMKDVYEEVEEKVYEKFMKLMDLCEEYFKKLENEFLYLQEDEAIEETLKVNEFKFDSEGNDL